MHGASLVTLDTLYCLTAKPDDPIIETIESWATGRDLHVRVLPVGHEDDAPSGDTTRQSDRAITPADLAAGPRGSRALGIAIGGDGTFLEAVRAFSPYGIPIAGVNRGRLSFLPRIPASSVTAALSEIRAGEAVVVDRQRVTVRTEAAVGTGLNDVTVEPPRDGPQTTNTVRAQAAIDREYVGEYSGQGVVVATPTGSTGWSLSAGAPVHRPANDETLQLVALHADTLGHRPIVFSSERNLTLKPRTAATIWVDGGRTVVPVGPDEHMHVTGADQPARIVRTSTEQPFMATLADKLGWALRECGPTPLKRSSPGGFAGPPLRSRPFRSRSDEDYVVRDQESIPTKVSGVAEWPAVDERPPGWPRVSRRTLDGVGQWSSPIVTGACNDTFLERARQVACRAALAAGQLAQEFATHGRNDSADTKSRVTAGARASEEVLTSILSRSFPEHDIFSENRHVHGGSSRYRWVLDPIDGEANYAHGYPNYCTSVALLEGATPVVGVVAVPESNELFHATQAGGAYRNRSRIGPTDRSDLAESLVLSGYDPDGQFLDRCYKRVRGVRKLGSQAMNLCFVAAGSADGLWEYDTYPWDVAAGVAILRAAGGTITDAEGEPYRFSEHCNGGPDPDSEISDDVTLFDTFEGMKRDIHARIDEEGGESPRRRPLLASNGPLHAALCEVVDDLCDNE